MTIQCGLAEMPNFKLVAGVGDYSEGTACIMSAAVACARLRQGLPLGEATDRMDCCCPLIRGFLISFNDNFEYFVDITDMQQSVSTHRTQTLMPFVPRLVDTHNPDLTPVRSYIAVDWMVRTVLPFALDAIERPDAAKTIRELPEIVNTQSAAAAEILMRSMTDVFKPIRHIEEKIYNAIDNLLMHCSGSPGIACRVAILTTDLPNVRMHSRRSEVRQLCCDLVDRLLRVSEDKTPAVV